MAGWTGSPARESDWRDRSAHTAETELAFETAEERLPWLQSDDDAEEPAPFDTGRLVGLGLIMLVALVALVAAVWFVTNRGVGTGPAPDGSLIQAPPTPYKERPASPGGKTFPGTGDTSYAVGAGKEIEARLAPATPTPLPVPIPSAATSPAATPATAASPKPRPDAEPGYPVGTAVQVGAYSSRADAEAGWQRLTGQTEALSGVSHRIVCGIL